jgi:hypothetical protein
MSQNPGFVRLALVGISGAALVAAVSRAATAAGRE